MSNEKQTSKSNKSGKANSPDNKYGKRGSDKLSGIKGEKGKKKQGLRGKKIEEKPVKVDFQKSTIKDSEKLQKVLARAGKGSRREIESYITTGRVSVDGKVAFLGDRVTGTEQIRIDGPQVKLTAQSDDM